jgi:putative phosphoesterase
MRIAVISDTHFPARGGVLPTQCRERLAVADLIIHAGDHCTLESVHVLGGVGPPVHAVRGNVDDRAVRAALPASIELHVAGHRIAVIHDAGPSRGRHERMRHRFPSAGIVIFGHSHIPIVEHGADGLVLVNPGSPTDRRRQPHHTMAELNLRPGHPPVAEIVLVDDDDGRAGQND